MFLNLLFILKWKKTTKMSFVSMQIDEKEEKEHKLDVLVASNHAVMITLQLFYAQIASVAWTP